MAARQVRPEVTELRERLRGAGVTLQAIADRVGVTKGFVWQQLAGRCPVQPRTMAAASSLMWERVQRQADEARALLGELREADAEQ